MNTIADFYLAVRANCNTLSTTIPSGTTKSKNQECITAGLKKLESLGAAMKADKFYTSDMTLFDRNL